MTNRLTEEQIAELLKQTRDAAQYFLEDLDHIRQVINAKEAGPGEIRRISAILRRLLVERALPAIATPRIGRIVLDVPDLKPVYVAFRSHPPEFYLAAGTSIFGSMFAGFAVNAPPGTPSSAPDENQIELPVESFLKQNVIFAEGRWLSRSDVIKYIANASSGVHAGVAKTPAEEILQRTRKRVVMHLRDEIPSVSFDIASSGPTPDLAFDKKHVDGVLIELLSAADRLATSKSVLALEALINLES